MATHPDSWIYGDFAPDPASRDLTGLKARWVLERLPASAAPDVLDYGTGEGKYLRLIRAMKPRARVVGVDVRDARSGFPFEFHRVAADERLPFADAAFDVIVSCDVLEHVDDLDRSLDELSRVLRPGGAFVGFVPVEGGLGPYSLFRMLDASIYRDTKDHDHAYRRRDMISRLASRFRVVKLSCSYHLIGATLDAVFFASFKAPVVGPKLERFWRGQGNIFYRSAAASEPSLLTRIVRLANRAAYCESRLFERVTFCSKGLHFHLEKP